MRRFSFRFAMLPIGIASVLLISALAPGTVAGPEGTGVHAGPSVVVASLTIRPDGTVNVAGVLTVVGNAYSLSANYTGSIDDERNGSTLNGSGWTIDSTGYSAGIFVNGASNVTVESFVLKDPVGGIDILNSSAVRASGNTIGAKGAAFSINDSSAVTVSENQGGSGSALYADGDLALTFQENAFPDATLGAVQILSSSSLALHGNVLANSTQTALAIESSDGMNVSGNDLAGARTGNAIFLDSSDSGNLSHNNLTGNVDPIYLSGSIELTLWDNVLSPVALYAVEIDNCLDVTIGGTTSLDSGVGVYLSQSYGISIVGSDFDRASEGVEVLTSEGVAILDSNLESDNTAVTISGSFNVSVLDSNLTDPNYGLVSDNSSGILVEGSNLSTGNYPVVLTDHTTDVQIERSDLQRAQSGSVLIENSSSVQIDRSTLQGAFAFGVRAWGSQDLSVSNSNLSGSGASPGNVGVSTSDDVGVNLTDDAITWTQNPFLDVGSREISITGSDLSNATYGGDALSFSHDERITLQSTRVDDANGTGLNLDAVNGTSVTNCQFDGSQGNGIAAFDALGLTIVNSTLDGIGESGLYAAQSLDVLAEDDSASNDSYGFFFDTAYGVELLGNTAGGDSSGSVSSFDGYGLDLIGNDFSNETGPGSTTVSIDATRATNLVGNDLSHDFIGALVEGAMNGTMVGNTFANDATSFGVEGPVIELLDHNDFSHDAGWNLQDSLASRWNASYPIGGNYWSNYSGVDVAQGPQQDRSGADGLGDTPMVLNSTTADHYPLMAPWAQHELVFLETGLPNDTAWAVVVNGTRHATSGSSIVLASMVGAESPYAYTVDPVSGFTVTPFAGNGTIGIPGRGIPTVRLVFSPIQPSTYSVVFQETGLPPGSYWTVSLGGATAGSLNGTVRFVRTNGSYPYQVRGIPGYSAASSSGTLSVSGGATIEVVPFEPVTYPVSVTESGLPSGYDWTITLGSNTSIVTGTTIEAELPNGTYSVTAGEAQGYVTAPAFSITVAGSGLTIYLLYTTALPSSVCTGCDRNSTTTPGLAPFETPIVLGGVLVAVFVGALLGWFVAWRRGPGGASSGQPAPADAIAPGSPDRADEPPPTG